VRGRLNVQAENALRDRVRAKFDGDVPSNDIVSSLAYLCRETDRAAAALIKDLKDRSLLDSTLVVWGGEFGRTP
jgi:hypothetical protein